MIMKPKITKTVLLMKFMFSGCTIVTLKSYTFVYKYTLIIGVPTTASRSDIEDAYYRLSKQLIPDCNPNSPEAVEKFKRVSAAYEVIGNPEQRRKYDAHLRPDVGVGGRASSPGFDDPRSGPAFSSVKGEQWRRKYDRQAGGCFGEVV